MQDLRFFFFVFYKSVILKLKQFEMFIKFVIQEYYIINYIINFLVFLNWINKEPFYY